MNIISILLFLNIAFAAPVDQCQSKHWKLSKLEFSPFDPYLETVLGFSYGPEVKSFIPKLSGSISRFYYEGTPDKSKFTFFSTYYSQTSEALKAFKHLQKRVHGKKLQDVFMKGKQVIWFAGRDITVECFRTMKESEINNL